MIVRLEANSIRHPRLDTLRTLAAALEVPLVTVLAEAGQIKGCGVPCIGEHLRLCYHHLPEAAIQDIEAYANKVVAEAGQGKP